MRIRRSEDRGHGDHGWLKARYGFSFANYHDPEHSGFRSLLVLNEDRVAGGAGFQPHGHRDMEILTWVLEGKLRHEDSAGNAADLLPGRIQRMTAGRGIQHSEVNGSAREELHLLQIWISPAELGLEPDYEEKEVPVASEPDRWHLAAAPRPVGPSAVLIRQDAELRIARLGAGKSLSHELAEGRGAWLQLARGRLRVGDEELRAGDAAAIETPGTIVLEALDDSEILLFDLA